MVEKMKFERKEKVKFWVRSGINFVFFVVALILCFQYPFMDDTKLKVVLRCVFIVVLIIFCNIVFVFLEDFFKTKKDENIAEFEYNAKIDAFLEYFGDLEIELKLEVKLKKAPKGFERNIIKNKLRYYVYKESPETLWISIRKGNEEIDGYEVDNDSAFLFKYFEPIYEVKKEE